MNFTQYIIYINGSKTKYKYFDYSEEKIIQMLKSKFNLGTILAIWAEDENGNQIAYFDKNTEVIKGEKMKKVTKEEVLERINFDIYVHRRDIKVVLDSLEEHGYIKFKKEPKEYKVFFKLVTIGEEKKKLYYVSSYHLTENIDEAKLFETNEDKDGYVPEIIKESSNGL